MDVIKPADIFPKRTILFLLNGGSALDGVNPGSDKRPNGIGTN
jgi:hypothetical protein